MKYVSIDIETTGLDMDKHQIVEIGAVIDELGSDIPLEDLPKFRAVLIHEDMTMGSYCANLHRDLWPEILAAKKYMGGAAYATGKYYKESNKISPAFSVDLTSHYLTPNLLEHYLYKWLCFIICSKDPFFPEHNLPAPIKINVAGKNPAGFDIPFIEALPNWQGLIKFHRRVFDPASHYALDTDKNLPDLQECLKRAGIDKVVSHTAVDDALDVVRLIRLRTHVKGENYFDLIHDGAQDAIKAFSENNKLKFDIASDSCIKCGGTMVGDEHSTVLHCETLDLIGEGLKPDSGPIYCGFVEGPEKTCNTCKHTYTIGTCKTICKPMKHEEKCCMAWESAN